MHVRLCCTLIGLALSSAAVAASGDLDTAFGTTSGYTLTDLGANDSGEDVLLDASGRIIVAAYRESGGTAAPALLAYTANGVPDTSFGVAGIAYASVTGGAYPANVAVARSTSVLYLASAAGDGIHVHAFDLQGHLQTSFGSNGEAVVATNGTPYAVFGLTVQGNRPVIAVGATNPTTGNRDFLVARLAGNGAPDTNFGTNGRTYFRRYTGAGAMNRLTRITLQADGKLVVAGRAAAPGGSYNFIAARLSASGVLDATFGTQGVAEIDMGDNDLGRTVAVQSDGRILVGGMRCLPDGTSCAIAVARLQAGGALDTSYGSGGKFVVQYDYGTLLAGMTLDAQGRLVGVGNMTLLDGSTTAYTVRLTSAGALDTAFAGIGIRRGYYGPANVNAHLGVVAQGSDRVVVVGSTGMAANGASNANVVITRLVD